MCGICGKLNLKTNLPPIETSLLNEMNDAIAHRGPDDAGVYVSGEVGLGNRRLKIIDLSTGHQPISNEDGTIWVVYNGETYNYQELTTFLKAKGHVFKTSTDTEVIVHLYEEFGEDCVKKLWGMFGFALWDIKKKKLLIARDRVGIKPLYYALTPEALVFGSEIKSILRDQSIEAVPDPEVLDQFLTYHYVPGEKTLFKGISKLPPGHLMMVENGKVEIKQYWDLNFPENAAEKSEKEYEEELVALLKQTVSDHMISDVPVGILLSGGVDSTGVLSFAVEQTGKQVNTFTIGFEGQNFADERPYARMAAERYGARHHEATITASEFSECISRYVWHMEEPVCEPPAIALYYITKVAREHVTVLLSGEGGDEAFAGYQNYRNLYWMEQAKSAMGPLAQLASGGMGAVGKATGLQRFKKYAPLMGMPFESYYLSRTTDPSDSFNAMKEQLYTSGFRADLSQNGSAVVTRQLMERTAGLDTLSRMLYLDTKTWLPDDLLVKADKMTMANSLELRVPLLDHRVLEFAAALPRSLKLRGLTTKYLLKKALTDRVPEQILNRKKTGFPVPYASWIRNEMKDKVREVLTDRKTFERGYFERAAIERILEENDREGRHSKEIFSLLVVELWHRIFADGSGYADSHALHGCDAVRLQ
jgi:asparagine synthase (glutamine-hydrolysing)